MRVFITGASGHVASAVIPELVEAGHDVIGLARNSKAAAIVESLGATARLGDLANLDGLREAAAAADGVIHLALFDSQQLRAGNLAGAGVSGVRAVAAMGEALAESGKPLISAAAIGALGPRGRSSTEADTASPQGPGGAESVVLGLAERGVRAAVVRLPLITHSRPYRAGFAGILIDAARRTGVSGYAGDGSNRWPAVHSIDAGHLFCLALEKAPAASRWHAVQDEGIAIREIAETIAEHLSVPTASIPDDELAEHFGFLGSLVNLDLPSTSIQTQSQLRWTPGHPDLMDDLRSEDFFSTGSDAP